jgi:hypothetical protein
MPVDSSLPVALDVLISLHNRKMVLLVLVAVSCIICCHVTVGAGGAVPHSLQRLYMSVTSVTGRLRLLPEALRVAICLRKKL